MIYCSIEELFEKFLQRLEEDYNVQDYTGNLVEQVLLDFLLTVKVTPHECVIRTGQP